MIDPDDNIVCKPGAQPDEIVMEEMRRKHPNARLCWAEDASSWALIDVTPNLPPILIRLIDGRPTLANTVYFLDSIHPNNIKDDYDVERLERELDNPGEVAKIQRRAKEQIHYGSSELWNAFKRKVMVPKR